MFGVWRMSLPFGVWHVAFGSCCAAALPPPHPAGPERFADSGANNMMNMLPLLLAAAALRPCRARLRVCEASEPQNATVAPDACVCETES